MNTRQKVLVTSDIPIEGIELLQSHFDVQVYKSNCGMKKEELIENIKDKQAIICLLSDIIDKEVMDAASNLKIISNYAVGYNNIDMAEATRRGIVITNTPEVLTHATADLAWTLLFSVARRVVEADVYTRQGNFKAWSPKLLLGQDITGKTLGIIGAGRIGRAFGKKAMAFDMKILYHNRIKDESFEKECGAQWVEKEELLRGSDFVSLHCPLTPETEHFIGEKELSLMKNTSILINTSRGAVVDEKALVKALDEKTIWGAGLDVYENEPYIEEKLKKLSNVVLLPHIGSATIETRKKMSIMAAENVIVILNGDMPQNVVNLELYP